MSRIGKKPVTIPKGVKVELAQNIIKVSGAKGELKTEIHPNISVEIKSEEVLVVRKNDEKANKALHGLFRALIANMIVGVTQGYSKKLELVGVGYRAKMQGKVLHMAVGLSHPIVFRFPDSIKIDVPVETSIIISGIDKQLVGLIAAKIRSFRPPEPYQGKGIKYDTEIVRRKAGKTAASK